MHPAATRLPVAQLADRQTTLRNGRLAHKAGGGSALELLANDPLEGHAPPGVLDDAVGLGEAAELDRRTGGVVNDIVEETLTGRGRLRTVCAHLVWG